MENYYTMLYMLYWKQFEAREDSTPSCLCHFVTVIQYTTGVSNEISVEMFGFFNIVKRF